MTWTKDSIKELLLKNNKAVERAMVVIYNNQTFDEQNSSLTKEDNGIGFSSAHAIRGTYYAQWVLSGKHLSGKHLENARKISLKYSSQLLKAIK